jgi:hypothetical protein
MFESRGESMSPQTMSEVLVTPEPSVRRDVRLIRAAPSLWRVQDATGRVIGHLQAVAQAGGTRFRARRYHPASRAFRDVGDFWSAEDAIDCLRLGR